MTSPRERSWGPIAILGSGETSASGGRILESVARGLPSPLRVAVLETPAGFEPNSAQVAGRVADFLRLRLQNWHPVVDLIPARKRDTPFSPDEQPTSSAALTMGPIALFESSRFLRNDRCKRWPNL